MPNYHKCEWSDWNFVSKKQISFNNWEYTYEKHCILNNCNNKKIKTENKKH